MRFPTILFISAVVHTRYLSPNYNEKNIGDFEAAVAMDEQQLYSYKTEQQDVDNEDFNDLEEELLDFEEQDAEYEEEGPEDDIDEAGLDDSAHFSSKSTHSTSDIAIFNSIWDPCSKNPIPSGKTSDFGCGDGLVCDRLVAHNPYLQCLPNDALKISLADGTDTCPISQLNVPGRARGHPHATCAAGSFCTGQEEWAIGTCKACRSKHSTCGASAFQHADSTLCCPGLSCTLVDATVDGQPGSKKICLPSRATPTATTPVLVKRGVKVGGPAATNYCYSGCSGVKAI